MKRASVVHACVAALLVLSTGCLSSDSGDVSSNTPGRSSSGGLFGFNSLRIPAGTSMDVRMTSGLSTETANRGDSWSGEVLHPVIVGDRVVVPAGSIVRGTVTVARGARRGTRAELDLATTSIMVNGTSHRVSAETEPVIAGSTRARNLGAIAGGAAAGALIGKAIGGDGHDALVGGLIGGAGAAGAVAASKGYQVRLPSGTVLTFTMQEAVAIR